MLSLAEPLVAEKTLSQFRFRREEALDIREFLEGQNILHIVVDGPPTAWIRFLPRCMIDSRDDWMSPTRRMILLIHLPKRFQWRRSLPNRHTKSIGRTGTVNPCRKALSSAHPVPYGGTYFGTFPVHTRRRIGLDENQIIVYSRGEPRSR